MLNRTISTFRILSWLTLLFSVTSPIVTTVSAAEESRSTLHTYTPAAPNAPGPFHCHDCWGLKPVERQPLTQHQAPRYRRGQHERGPRPHRNPFAKKSRFHSAGLRSLPRHALSMGSFERTVESWQVRTVDGDTIRYGTDRIRIRGYNAPELSEPGGRDAALRLERLLQEGTINIVPHGHDVYGRTLADVFVNGRNVAEVMTGEGFGRRG
ncbi:MAG: thermonuclease family protein [Nitrospirota bacterium]|nr:thermonuclease family protein [Nitrospirota bacterium]